MLRTFFHRVLRAGTPSVFCPFYHAVHREVPPHLKYAYTPRTPDAFQQDVIAFRKYFHPVKPIQLLKKNERRPHELLVTFDDGLRSFKDEAWPILRANGIRPILFVNPAFVDEPTLMYRYKASLLLHHAASHSDLPPSPYSEKPTTLLQLPYSRRTELDELATAWGVDWAQYVNETRPYLSLAELRQLASEGVYIGAHSMDHPYYHELDLEAQVHQTQASLDWVQENLHVDYRFFSFPFTDEGVSPEWLDRVDVDLSFGTQKIKQEFWPAHHQRLCMERAGESAERILWAEHAAFQSKRWLGRHRANHPRA